MIAAAIFGALGAIVAVLWLAVCSGVNDHQQQFDNDCDRGMW